MHQQLNEVSLSHSISRRSGHWPTRRIVVGAVAIACCALSSPSRAVTPAPDGFYGLANTAEGEDALFSLTSGFGNSAIGYQALHDNTTGGFNTATGYQALVSLTTGANNTASGASALSSNTGANGNTANGFFALSSNITGFENTASGDSALYANAAGSNNTASGSYALNANISGSNNAATGAYALYNDTGANNTAEGFQALSNNIAGTNNIALGYQAGLNLTSGSNNIDIGAAGAAGESGRIRIGTKGKQTATFIAGISGKTVASGVGVIINTNGQLGTIQSSARFKKAIKPMDKASEALLGLEPVTFRYKHDLDPDGVPQFGLIAEQVAKVDPNLVVRDDDGKVSTVRYEAVNAMLLNEFLKEHRTVEEQQATIAKLSSAVAKQQARSTQQKDELQGRIAQQQKQIEALAANLQKISDRIKLGKPASQVVANQY